MKTIPLSQGYETIVDDDDFEVFGKVKWFAKIGGTGGRPYAARSIHFRVNGKWKTKTLRLHRLIAGDPPGFEIDHIDGDTLNNQKSNLQAISKQENLEKRQFRKTY